MYIHVFAYIYIYICIYTHYSSKCAALAQMSIPCHPLVPVFLLFVNSQTSLIARVCADRIVFVYI